MSEKFRIGVVIGSEIAPNERVALRTLQKILVSDVEFNLITNYICSQDSTELSIYRGSEPPFPIFGPKFLREFIITFWSTLTYLKNRNPDIMFFYTQPHLYGIISVILGKLYRVPTLSMMGGEVFKWHKFQTGISKLGIIFFLYPLAFVTFHLSDHIVVIGKKLVKMLLNIGLPFSKITFARWPVDKDIFRPIDKKEKLRRELSLPQDKTIVLTASRMSKVEEVGYYHEIVKEISNRSDDFFFVFVGKATKYEKEIRKAGGDKVKIVGRVPLSEMPKYYNAADLLTHLSLTEGSVAGTILEAIACDTPVVSTPSGEAEDLLPITCNTTDEFVQFLHKEKWPKSDLPPEFDNSEIRKRYLEILSDLRNQTER